MSENYSSAELTSGKTMIAPGVLLTIARLTALSIPGVVGMAPIPGGVDRIFRRGTGDGVRIEVENNSVSVDLYLILSHGINVREVGRKVQLAVSRAIEEMVGMSAARIDIHIENIQYDKFED